MTGVAAGGGVTVPANGGGGTCGALGGPGAGAAAGGEPAARGVNGAPTDAAVGDGKGAPAVDGTAGWAEAAGPRPGSLNTYARRNTSSCCSVAARSAPSSVAPDPRVSVGEWWRGAPGAAADAPVVALAPPGAAEPVSSGGVTGGDGAVAVRPLAGSSGACGIVMLLPQCGQRPRFPAAEAATRTNARHAGQ